MTTNDTERAAETIGQRLRRLRTERRLSQRELASKGVSYAYISRIEAGSRQPSVKALRMLARKLGVTADYLETGSELPLTQQRELDLSDAELAIRLGTDAERAEAALRALLDDATADGDRSAATRARIALGLAAAQSGRNPEAITLLEDALADDPPSPATRPDLYATLGRAYVAAGMSHRAAEIFETCLAETTEQAPENTAVQVRFATYLSQSLANTGDLARAEAVVEDALGRAKDLSDPYTHVRLYWSLARLSSLQGHAQAALDQVRKAIALLEATEDTVQLARAHLLCAAIMNLQGKGADAGPPLEAAEKLLGPNPDPVDLASLRTEQAKAAAARGDGDEAVTRAREALEAVGDDDPAERGGALFGLAQGLALQRDTAGSNDAFAESVRLLGESGQWRECAQAYRTWGKLLRELGREAEAMDALERAADFATRTQPAPR